MNILLCVYGTLKQCFQRSQFLRDQRYLGVCKTTPEYGIYAYGGFPALVDSNLAQSSDVKANSHIYGELYEVDENCLVLLDDIEGVGDGLFFRQTLNLQEINFFRLPLTQECWNMVEAKKAEAYFFKRSVKGAANCGSFWSK